MPECDKVLLVQAELDGELDAAEAAALAVHRTSCEVCREAAADLAQARALLGGGLRHTMPDDARARLMARLEAAQPRSRGASAFVRWRAWWASAAGFGLGAACAAAVALLLVVPHQASLVDEVVASHIRALQPGHLEDVVSTDQHTVKPWFDGRIDFAPPVRDLAAEQFPLKGGRLDYLAGRPVAVLVYQHAKHLIDLYVWPATGGPQALQSAQHAGYNVVHWVAGGMQFWAASDLEADLLRRFAEDFRRSP